MSPPTWTYLPLPSPWMLSFKPDFSLSSFTCKTFVAGEILIYFCCFNLCCYCLVTKSCLTLCDLMDCSMPGFLVLHWISSLLKFMSIESMFHPTISSFVVPFSFCPKSFPALGLFLSWLITSGGQNIGASASTSVLPINIQGWFPLGLTVWSLCCPRDSQESSPAPNFKTLNSLVLSFLMLQISHSYMTTGKTITLTILTFVSKVMSLLFNMLPSARFGSTYTKIGKIICCPGLS